MRSSVRVTVVMPAYNAETWIGASISSVLWQTMPDVELIVVDDGSADRTVAIAASFDQRVRLICQQSAGPGMARNVAMAEARGDLIAFCDADDLLFPQHLEALVATHERHGGIATGNAWYLFPGGIDRSKVRLKGRFPPPAEQRLAILQANFVSIMSLFPRRLFDEVGPMADDILGVEDWDYWMRAVFAGYPVHRQPRPLALYRVNEAGLSSGRPDLMEAHVLKVLRRAEERLELTPEEYAYVRRRLSAPGVGALATQADTDLQARRYRAASRAYAELAALVPSEHRLVWKARLLGLSPRILGPVMRGRELRRRERLGVADADVP